MKYGWGPITNRGIEINLNAVANGKISIYNYRVKSICKRGSPPLTVTPPPEGIK